MQESLIHQENIELYKKVNLLCQENTELQKKVCGIGKLYLNPITICKSKDYIPVVFDKKKIEDVRYPVLRRSLTSQVSGAECVNEANRSSQVSYGLLGYDLHTPINLQLSQPLPQKKEALEKALKLG